MSTTEPNMQQSCRIRCEFCFVTIASTEVMSWLFHW